MLNVLHIGVNIPKLLFELEFLSILGLDIQLFQDLHVLLEEVYLDTHLELLLGLFLYTRG